MDFGSLPVLGGFVITIGGPDEPTHDEDKRILDVLPESGSYEAKDLVYRLLDAVSKVVMSRGELEERIVSALQVGRDDRQVVRTLIESLDPHRRAMVPLGTFHRAYGR